MLGLKNVGSNKILGPEEFWVSTKSGSTKNGWGGKRGVEVSGGGEVNVVRGNCFSKI